MSVFLWIIVGFLLLKMLGGSQPQTTTNAATGQPVSFLNSLFSGFLNSGASQAAGQPVTQTFLPSNLLSSDFGGTATPTAANDPIGLAIGATPTPGGIPGLSGGIPLVNGQVPEFGPPSPAPGDITQANTDAAKSAAASDTNSVTGNNVLPVDDSGDGTNLGFPPGMFTL